MQDQYVRSVQMLVGRQRLWGAGAVLVLGMVASGCSHEVVAVGSCSIHADEAGQPILECPDGSRRNLARQLDGDGNCSVETLDGGVVEMTCSDGQSHRFDGKVAPVENSEGCQIRANTDGGRDLVCGTQVEQISAGCPDGFPGNVTLVGVDALLFVDDGSQSGFYMPDSEVASFYLFRMSGCRKITGDLDVFEWSEERLPVSLRLLESVGGSVAINDNSGLTQAAFPKLTHVGGSVRVSANPLLAHLNWNSELSVGEDVDVSGNESLPMCQVTELLERTSIGEESVNEGNSEVCP